nr:MAG TPA: CMP/hydroxymethyl CMP hydrolase [Caudoviricetes sp.]
MGEKKPKTCFIVCPISSEDSDIRKNSDKLLKHLIQPVCNKLGFETVRIDKHFHNEQITDEIIRYLEEAELVIADTTTNNPNCFYEIGYRKAISKPLILIRSIGENLPFDISGINSLSYNLQDLDNVEEFKEKLEGNISILDFEKSFSKNKTDKNSDEILNKIFNLLLTIDNKMDKFNSNIISEITKNFVSSVDKKNENEVMLQFLKTVLENPKHINSLVELGKIAKDQEK